jgi:hypothetical protein
VAYDPPTLTELEARVARDLRDPDLDTFTTAQLDDFINMGIAELNTIRPKESRVVYQGDKDWATDLLPFNYVWMVEIAVEANVGDTLMYSPIHAAAVDFGYERSGWEFYAGHIRLPGLYESGISNLVDRYTAAQVYIAVWGYADREFLLTGTDVADFESGLDELIVRLYAKGEGLRALSNDFALYQQWQAAANNADISPTQLGNLMAAAQGDFQRMRKRHHVIRRPVTGG